jgi:hypothetical protein
MLRGALGRGGLAPGGCPSSLRWGELERMRVFVRVCGRGHGTDPRLLHPYLETFAMGSSCLVDPHFVPCEIPWDLKAGTRVCPLASSRGSVGGVAGLSGALVSASD